MMVGIKKKAYGDNEKFFAIVLWNVLGHQDEVGEPYYQNRAEFFKKTDA